MVNQRNQEKYEELTSIRLRLQKDEDLAAYYQMLDEQDENQRILIHDIKKHLQSITFLNEDHEHHKLSQYVNQLLQSSELKDSLRVCDYPILNSILCRYIKQAKEGHISFHADIRKNTTHFLKDQDLTTIFCNLLDNAFKAALQVPEGYVELYVNKQSQTPFVSLSLINSCRKNPFSRDGKILPRRDKSGYHGYGIKSVEKVVKKYDGEMKMYYDIETQTFHTILYMKVEK
jgi:sensor histidine kinase regulating citrate/malate metabolism